MNVIWMVSPVQQASGAYAWSVRTACLVSGVTLFASLDVHAQRTVTQLGLFATICLDCLYHPRLYSNIINYLKYWHHRKVTGTVSTLSRDYQ